MVVAVKFKQSPLLRGDVFMCHSRESGNPENETENCHEFTNKK